MALEQFNISDLGAEFCSDPHTAFIFPPIYAEKPGKNQDIDEAESDESQPIGADADERTELSLSSILRSKDNFLLVGDREVGKTSLAHYISVLVSEGETNLPRVPVVVDYRKLKPNLYSLKRQAAAYLGPLKNGFDVEAALNSGNFSIIVDNFSGQDTSKKSDLQKLITSYPLVKWIFLADTRLGSLNKKTSQTGPVAV